MELITPYGGKLIDLVARGEERHELAGRAGELSSIQLSARTLCDLELMAVGGLSPLDRFLGESDYRRVVGDQRLANGMIFPLPITLGVDDARSVRLGQMVALRNEMNNLVACMLVEEIYERDVVQEARQVCGTLDERHPVAAEMRSWGRYCVSGALKVIELPRRYDFPELRRTPAHVRALLAEMGNSNVLALHTHGPIHRAQEESTKRAAMEMGASLLILPSVGMNLPGDVDHYTRVRAYRALVEQYFTQHNTLLSLAPYASRKAGPRESVLHAIIHRNYGANHTAAGQDHTDAGADGKYASLHEPAEAMVRAASEVGVQRLLFDEPIYLTGGGRYEENGGVDSKRKSHGKPQTEWSTRPEVADILSEAYPPSHKQGFCIWFTGLPSSGKSTISDILIVMLMEHGRQVTVLDGDVVRTHLSKGLGFSREDRDVNVCRIGFVASEIVRHHGSVICAAVSPYRSTRNRVRSMMGEGSFIEVFVDTPLRVCEERDVKGYYARARSGDLKGFTGVDDPYEPPVAPEIHLSTDNTTAEENAKQIIGYLCSRGLLVRPGRVGSSDFAARPQTGTVKMSAPRDN